MTDKKRELITGNNPFIKIEATDEADAHALKARLAAFLSKADKGDYCGRVIEIKKEAEG